MTFTARCRAGVIRMMARSPRSASPEKNRETDHHGMVRLRSSAPTTKSYWSRIGALAPRALCIRRLTNAPTRSPKRAPKARTAEAANATPYDPKDQGELGATRLNGTDRSKPRNAPDRVPPTRPRQGFPSPKSRSPSRRVRPKSIGVPPPNTTAIGFATKAGRKNHKACGIDSRAIAAGVGRDPDIDNPHPAGPEPFSTYLCLEV